MKTLVASLALMLLAGPALSAQAQAAKPPTFTGSWTLTADTEHGEMSFALAVEQKGEKFTGTFITDHGEAPLEGTVANGVLKLAAPEGMNFELTAKLSEDGTMSGTFASEMGVAKFTGKRTRLPASHR